MSSRIDPNSQNNKNVNNFLDYMATHPDFVVRFHAADMILRTDTDASYLTKPQSHSIDVAYFLLGSIPSKFPR